MVSMKQIAELCGVSVATVSKALNDQKDIGEETRAAIKRKAEELGYMTNSAARMLKTNRSYNLGVLFEDMGGLGFTHEFFASVLEGFKAEAARKGYDITFISKDLFSRSSTYFQHCKYRGFDGIGIICANFFDNDILDLIRSDIPIATVDHVFDNCVSVISDNFNGVASLVRHAYAKGHRRLAYIRGDSTSVTQNRFTGFCRTCEELGLEYDPRLIKYARYYDADSSYAAAAELIAMEDRPTCILFPDDFSLIGGIRAIEEAGLKIPEDISVMGYDGIIVSQVMSPKITTYRQSAQLIGSTAAAKLIEFIDNPNTTVLDRIIVEGELIEGESVKQL